MKPIKPYTLWICFVILLVKLKLSTGQRSRRGTVKTQDVSVQPGSMNIVRLEGNTKVSISVTEVMAGTRFIQLDAHTQIYPITMSLVPKEKKPGFYTTGKHIGLLKLENDMPGDESFYIFNENADSVNVSLIARTGSDKEPVPGGCNSEFEPAIAPYLVTAWADTHSFSISFEPAGLCSLFNALSDEDRKRGKVDAWPSCDKVFKELTYQFYTEYLPQGDYTEETLFRSIELMSDANKMDVSGYPSYPNEDPPYNRETFVAYPDFGLVITVVASFVKNSSVSFAYTPMVVYSCNRTSTDSQCPIPVPFYDKVLCSFMICIGLFLCFFGHRYFKCTIVIIGYCTGAIIAYMIMFTLSSRSTGSEELYTEALFLGLIGAGFWLALWDFIGSPLIVVLKFCISAGCLVAAMIYFFHPYIFPLSFESVFQKDINFWLIFAIVVMIVPIVGIHFLHKTSIIMTVFVGSFITIFAVSLISRSSIAYISINIIDRILLPGYNVVNVRPPIHLREDIILVAWIFLLIIGISFQLHREKHREQFPEPRFVHQRGDDELIQHAGEQPTHFTRSLPDLHEVSRVHQPLHPSSAPARPRTTQSSPDVSVPPHDPAWNLPPPPYSALDPHRMPSAPQFETSSLLRKCASEITRPTYYNAI